MIERLAVAVVAPLWLVSAGGAVSVWAVLWLTGGLRQPARTATRP